MPDVVRPVVDTLLNPPLRFLREFPQSPDLTGSGNLPNIADGSLRWTYGGVFIARDIPPGLSRSANIRPVWTRALMNLNFLGITFGPSPPLPIRYEEQHYQTWVCRWFAPDLSNIEYDILPGVRIEYAYLRLG